MDADELAEYQLSPKGFITYLMLKFEREEQLSPIVILTVMYKLMEADVFNEGAGAVQELPTVAADLLVEIVDNYEKQYQEFMKFHDIVAEEWDSNEA